MRHEHIRWFKFLVVAISLAAWTAIAFVDEPLVISDSRTAVLDPANWDTVFVNERYFDAVRPMLVVHSYIYDADYVPLNAPEAPDVSTDLPTASVGVSHAAQDFLDELNPPAIPRATREAHENIASGLLLFGFAKQTENSV